MLVSRGAVRALEAIARRIFEPRIDYLAAYASKVIEQASDGTLAVSPDSDRLPGMTGVPIRYGVPGVSAKVKRGARVLVTFEGGNPERPIATIWESAALDELRITGDRVVVDSPDVRLCDGDIPLARAGDAVACVVGPVEAARLAAMMTGSPIPTVIPGVIASGSSKAKSK